MPASRSHCQFSYYVSQVIPGPARNFRRQLESKSQKGVSRQNRNRLPEDLMRSRHAATKIVIVHAWQIIVDERVGMDTFHRGSERNRSFRLSSATFAGSQTQDRTQPFAAREDAVAHRLVNRLRFNRCLWQKHFERSVNHLLPCHKIHFHFVPVTGDSAARSASASRAQ